MKRDLVTLANQTFDLLVIGGGIFGAGIARDAALRGLRVALIDKSDFASGTSSRSSKLIHGGFRYLEQYNFHLVAEACRERRILQEIAPHLVHPQPFLLPVYEGDRRSLAKLRLGMTLYDLLARFRNTAPHRTLPPQDALLKEPTLAPAGLRGAILYYDCREDDARFCLDNIIHATECGATCANYCELMRFVTRDDQLVAASVRDQLSSTTFEICARFFVNAAGPWVERIAGFVPGHDQSITLNPTKGVHLLLPKLTQEHAITFQAKSDGRILFILPWGDCSLLGTTDTNFTGDPATVNAEPGDIAYLLSELHALMPGVGIGYSDIITTFAGVRALLRKDDRSPSARSREHVIVQHGRNLLTIAGGKYTTYRAIAEQVVDRTYKMLGEHRAPCRTAKTPLPQHRPQPSGERIADSPSVFASDIAHACEYEMAVTLTDVMRRRTQLALSRRGEPATAAVVARLMAGHLGWTEDESQRQLQSYVNEWRRARS